jgi:hypothetical protein
MALPAGLEAVMPLPFEGLGAGRSGRFTFDGQLVTFRRTGDSLSVFDRLRLDRVSVGFEHPEARGRCDGRATAVTVGIIDTPAWPLALSCRFTGPVSGALQLREPRRAGAAPARHARGNRPSAAASSTSVRSTRWRARHCRWQEVQAALAQVTLALGLLFDPALTLG